MVKTTIAIIGATEIMGAYLAKKLAKANFRVLLFGHDSEKLKCLSDEIKADSGLVDIDCLSCLVDAGWEADIIISAVPHEQQAYLAKKIRQVATQKIVVNLRSSLNETLHQSIIHPDIQTDAFKDLLPGSKVVKVEVSVHSDILNPADIILHNAFIFSDNKEALLAIQKIFITAGFNVILSDMNPV